MSRQRSPMRKKTVPPASDRPGQKSSRQQFSQRTSRRVSVQRTLETKRSTTLRSHPVRFHRAVPQPPGKGKIHSGHRTYHRFSRFWKDYLLWAVAIITLLLGCYSLAGGSFPTPFLVQPGNASVLASPSPEPNHPILRVQQVALTSDQWQSAVQAAFSARASSGEYQGGTRADDLAINTAALHSLLDPIALTSLAGTLGISTDTSTLYQEWLKEASPQDRESARQHENDPAFKQNMAIGQLRLDVVKKAGSLPSITPAQVYQFYLQHPERFARSAPQMWLQQIVVSTQPLAQQIYQALTRGEAFSTLEASYDTSSPFYRARGGDLGWIALGGPGYPPEWAAHALTLRPGQFTTPFSVGGRYFILKCSAGPDYQPWPFATVQEQAHQDLEQEMINTILMHLVVSQEKMMPIEILDPHFAGIVQDFQASLSKSSV